MAKQVMLVDDDPAMHKVVGIVLSDTDYELAIASSGQECLEKLRGGFKGLILMDIMMPDLSGWETVAAMVREGLVDGCGICMLSALRDMAPKDPQLERYVISSLAKPFTYDQLLNTVQECMARIE